MSAIKIGDKVSIHGWGHGTVVEIGDQHQHEPDEWIKVQEYARECECDCGHRHTVQKSKWANLMHVSRQL